MKHLAFLSDFGLKDGYVAQMKAGALRFCDANIIDISHDVEPQNIVEAAFILRATCPFLPVGTVVVAVVDPGVGTSRKGLVITTKHHILIGPDNGVLIPAARHLGDFLVYEIQNQRLFQHPVSSTFHGRDIFAPVAAHILNGIPFDAIGPRISRFVDMTFDDACIHDTTIVGKVLHIDRFGNVITNISEKLIRQHISTGSTKPVELGGQKIDAFFCESYGFGQNNTVLGIVGSAGYLEFSLKQSSAAERFNLHVYDPVQIYL
ncbi:MAG: SAM-dependent chlorinase/fluorinase [Candidatus Thermoplasmatota archaeon]